TRTESQLILAVDDDAVSLGKPGCDDRLVGGGGSDRDRARVDDTIGLDDPCEDPLRPALNGRRRNDQDVAAYVEEDARVDEVSRPKLLVLVGKHRLETNRGAGLINDIVDQQQG